MALSVVHVLRSFVTEDNQSSCGGRLVFAYRCPPSASFAPKELYFLPQLSPAVTHNDPTLRR